MVLLEPDVAAFFPDDDSVNEALRVLVQAAKKVAPAAWCRSAVLIGSAWYLRVLIYLLAERARSVLVL